MQKSKAAKTCKHYQQAVKQFFNWMMKDNRAGENPLAHLKPVTVTKANTEQRRALEPEEIQRLLAATETAGTARGMTGHERVLLYRLAVETGLRAAELRSLTVSSFDYDRQTVTVKEQDTKNRRDAILPLRQETTALLKQFTRNKTPQTAIFNMPHRSSIVKMFRADLEKARTAWLKEAKKNPEEYKEREENDFLDHMNTSNGKLDFHALRHTFGSLLAASGVHPKTAQELMRHSDINLTMSRYTHIFRGQEQEAVDKLPNFDPVKPQQAKATGTDGKQSESAYKPAYKKLAKNAYSGCQQSAKDGSSQQCVKSESIKNWGGHKSCDIVALGAEKKPMTTDVTGWNRQWAGLDSNQRRLTPMGLQPIPFSHSGTDPNEKSDSTDRKP